MLTNDRRLPQGRRLWPRTKCSGAAEKSRNFGLAAIINQKTRRRRTTIAKRMMERLNEYQACLAQAVDLHLFLQGRTRDPQRLRRMRNVELMAPQVSASGRSYAAPTPVLKDCRRVGK